MPLDTSIPLQVQSIKTVDPRELYSFKAQMDQNALANQLGQLQLQNAQRQSERQNKLADLLSQQYAKPEERESALMQGGFLDEATKLGKDRRENAKVDAETAASQFKLAHEKAMAFANLAGSVRDQNSYNQALQTAKSMGLDISSAPAQYDPRFVQNFGNQALTQAQRIEQEWKNRTASESERHNRASEGIQIRGQNMTDARAREANQGKAAENSSGLRKEFEQLPEVKNYKQALPVYKGLEDATKRDTTQADINIVYGLAKLYDPNSVVREGEYATVANSPNIPDRIKGYANYLAGGGRLTKEVREKILAEAQGRMRSYEGEYEKSRKGYEDIATRSGADKTLVFPSSFEPAVKPSAPAAPKAGAVQDGYRFKGGNPADPKNWEKV